MEKVLQFFNLLNKAHNSLKKERMQWSKSLLKLLLIMFAAVEYVLKLTLMFFLTRMYIID